MTTNKLHPIAGFEGYFVDEEGRVWSKHRRGRAGKFGPVYDPTPLKSNWTNKNSACVSGRYLSVTLTDASGKKHSCGVHTLVCAAFRGPKPGPDSEVRHLDGDASNNRATNLAWGSRADNRADQEAHGTFSRAKLRPDQVSVIKASASSNKVLAEQYGVNEHAIYLIKTGRTWKRTP